MTVTIAPGKAYGKAAAPPSKSEALRLMICSSLTEDSPAVRGTGECEDIIAAKDCISALKSERDSVFNCRDSASALRFFIPIALALRGRGKFCGTERLMERGVSVYRRLLEPFGVRFEQNGSTLTVTGKLVPGKFMLPGNVSSQYISGLLFALPLLGGEGAIELIPPVESRPYIEMTLDCLHKSGIDVIKASENSFIVPGSRKYSLPESTVGGDWSNAAVLFSLNEAGGNVEVTGLDNNSFQGDKCCLRLFEKLRSPGAVIDISDCPDLGPLLFAVAALHSGGKFIGVRRLREKESNRIASMAVELKKFGIETVEEENRFTVLPGTLRSPSEPLHSHNDHRIAMALAVLCTKTGGSIECAGAVNKSMPEFWDTLEKLHIGIEKNNRCI